MIIFLKIEVQLIYNVLLVSDVQHSDSVMYLFQIRFPYSLLQNTEYSSLCISKQNKTNNPIKNQAEDINKHFSKEGIKMANEHIFKNAQHRQLESKNYNAVSPHTSQNDHHQKNVQIINAGKSVEEKEPSYTVDGNVS